MNHGSPEVLHLKEISQAIGSRTGRRWGGDQAIRRAAIACRSCASPGFGPSSVHSPLPVLAIPVLILAAISVRRAMIAVLPQAAVRMADGGSIDGRTYGAPPLQAAHSDGCRLCASLVRQAGGRPDKPREGNGSLYRARFRQSDKRSCASPTPVPRSIAP